jgi:hypothetical protein
MAYVIAVTMAIAITIPACSIDDYGSRVGSPSNACTEEAIDLPASAFVREERMDDEGNPLIAAYDGNTHRWTGDAGASVKAPLSLVRGAGYEVKITGFRFTGTGLFNVSILRFEERNRVTPVAKLTQVQSDEGLVSIAESHEAVALKATSLHEIRVMLIGHGAEFYGGRVFTMACPGKREIG